MSARVPGIASRKQPPAPAAPAPHVHRWKPQTPRRSDKGWVCAVRGCTSAMFVDARLRPIAETTR